MFKEVALASYLYVPKAELTARRLRELREELTLTPWSNDGPKEPVELFHEKADFFGVPMYHFMRNLKEAAHTVHDLRTEGKSIKFNFTSKPRPGQVPVLNAFESWMAAGATGFLLEARPGFGKTVTVLKMIQMIGRTALIVVPRSNLVKQWIDRALKHTDLKANEIGYVNGTQVNWRGKKLVVGLVHSLALDRLGNEFRKNFGIFVADEVDHSIPPSTFAPVIGMIPAKYRIGASAEMKRFDGMHVVFHKHMGQVHLKGVAGDQEVMLPTAVVVEFSGSSGQIFGGLGAMQRRGVLLSRLAKNPARNLLIAKYVKMIYNSGRRVVVLSDRVEHLMTLRDLAIKVQGVPRSETGLYVGSVPRGGKLSKRRKVAQQDLDRIASDCNVIFATYQMFALGTDIQELAGLVYATPQSDVVQSKGRIERFIEGKKPPVLVDITDTEYADAKRWALKREKYYRAERMNVKRVKE